MEAKTESNADQDATTVSGRLQRRVILRMLMDSKSWKLRDKGTELEEMVHKDGWRYYSSCHCITLRKDNSKFYQGMGIFMWMITAPLAWINTRRVKRAR